MNQEITANIRLDSTGDAQPMQLAPERALSPAAAKTFFIWTALWWSLAGACAMAFYFGALDFRDSSRISLYGISIWLNGWLLAFLVNRGAQRSSNELYHDCLAIWMLSYAFTNLVWEIPWIIFSPILFVDMSSLDDLLAHTEYMRESLLHMYWWSLGSFASVDLRTINGDPTFYTLELYAFVNLATIIWFFHLNKKRSPHRYLVAVLGCGEPVASTFIFSFTEVFADFENMTGGVADTLLALVWTQYQYFLFPLIFGALGVKLLREDWRHSNA
ncbi:MAG: hypothetical protein ACPHER_10460 [Nevskiales bacterium]